MKSFCVSVLVSFVFLTSGLLSLKSAAEIVNADSSTAIPVCPILFCVGQQAQCPIGQKCKLIQIDILTWTCGCR